MKQQKTLKKQFTYFEPHNVMKNIIIDVLVQIKWLSNDHFKENDVNLIKVGSKTFLSKIIKFNDNTIEFVIEFKNIGKQTWRFTWEDYKGRTILELYTIINYEPNISIKKIKQNKIILKNSFKQNAKKIDSLIRDVLDEKGLKSYF